MENTKMDLTGANLTGFRYVKLEDTSFLARCYDVATSCLNASDVNASKCFEVAQLYHSDLNQALKLALQIDTICSVMSAYYCNDLDSFKADINKDRLVIIDYIDCTISNTQIYKDINLSDYEIDVITSVCKTLISQQ